MPINNAWVFTETKFKAEDFLFKEIYINLFHSDHTLVRKIQMKKVLC